MPLASTRGCASIQGYKSLRGSATPVVPPAIGAPYEGGFFFGVINDGGTLYELIISPRAQGNANFAYSTTAALGSENNYSVTDGWSNTNVNVTAARPANQWVRSLTINGYSDWYIAARDEMELMYRNLKPVANANTTGNRTYTTQQGDTVFTTGNNQNSVPIGAAYTTTDPAMTPLADFQSPDGVERIASTSFAFCTSTRYLGNTTSMLFMGMDNGRQTVGTGYTAALPVRAIRRKLRPNY